MLAIPALLAALGAQAQERTADPLAPLAQCINRSEFQFKAQDRLPAGATTRSVMLATDTRQGVEVLGLNNPNSTQSSGVISVYTLLHAASGNSRRMRSTMPCATSSLPCCSIAWPIQRSKAGGRNGDISHEQSSAGT